MKARVSFKEIKTSTFHAILLVLAVVVCYWNSLEGELVHDDIFAIRDNQDIRPDTPLSHLLLNDFWGRPMSDPASHKSYRPLTILTFRLNYVLSGLEPWSYHVGNVLLHLSCTLLLWWACRTVVWSHDPWPCFTAALLFAVHPVHTEAVSYAYIYVPAPPLPAEGQGWLCV